MDILIRPAVDADFPQIALLDGAAFGFTYSEQDVADALIAVDPSRFYVATEADRIVGVTGDYHFDLTLPGAAGTSVGVPGVTWVSVSPVHRRRGILRALMERQLGDFADRGEMMTILTASEGGIYRRFGFGPATRVRKTVIDRQLAVLNSPESSHANSCGPVSSATPEQARSILPPIHDRWRRTVPGALSRSPSWWERSFIDRETNRNGSSAVQYVVHADGFVAYRIEPNWADGRPQHVCVVTDYVWMTAEAHRALWQVLLGLDLVGTIESRKIALDDPLPHLLDNPRQLRTTVLNDGIWVRPLDIESMLSARTFQLEIDAVLEVVDETGAVGATAGRYALKGGPDGAECVHTDRLADLRITVDALGSAYLGGMRLGELAAAGRVEVSDAALLRRLDLAFLADRVPVHGTDF
ncbi:GNAT family N-acetyltransferase [Jatrophihabitans sp. DSM 45814]